MMSISLCLVLFTLSSIIGISASYSGEYIPKSFYIIDPEGHQSDLVYIRNRRDIIQSLARMRRSDSYASASSSSSAHASAGSSATASSVSHSSVTSFGGGGGGGYVPNLSGRSGYNDNNGNYGNGAQGVYDGPILFSRSGEDTGTGVRVSGQAQGPKAAYASSSSSIDDKGKIKYSVQSGKY